ncbi:hypothetical protein E1B28_002488 [Marasmius oreades]|uniref:Cytokinin riboside 5'-monophosphate phosphoribohydrolase n=1 Tax=Marasmius oreades TaxID=181124 RepID=A0A9P7UKR3_9AGAR|nr:uncharacterized protein E1B28_002488 [Marasmius oreades]KAG7086537.1 hypothetical protein E1B28_002488 [Marasmius oreades]
MTIRSVSENAIAVFCGSSSGNHPAYIRAAQSLGKSLAIANRRLVYGGGEQGLMGAVFQATLTAGGKVTAINLRTFMEQGGEREKVPENTICGARETGYGMFVPPASCQVETVVVESLQDRKLAMAKRCRGFIGLPGGFGTYDEVLSRLRFLILTVILSPFLEQVFEVATWTQIGLQNRRKCVLNPLLIVLVHTTYACQPSLSSMF